MASVAKVRFREFCKSHLIRANIGLFYSRTLLAGRDVSNYSWNKIIVVNCVLFSFSALGIFFFDYTEFEPVISERDSLYSFGIGSPALK